MKDYEKKSIGIPFGAFDSELGGWEYTLPEGYEAEIKDGKVIIRKVESKDEKIRKALLEHIKGITSWGYFLGISREQMIAWLEKQRLISRDAEKRDLWEYVEEFKEKFGHLPKDTDEVVVCVDYIMKRLKPNEKWSEEDEKTVHLACEFIRHHSNPIDSIGGIDCSTLIERLKSLKNRIGCEANFITTKEWSDEDKQYLLVCKNALAKYQVSDKWDANIISRWLENKFNSLRPQPKQEWSEEDERLIEEATECLRKYASKVQGGNSKVYVMSLADRIESLRPQNTWKPSDEQIEMLENVRNILHINNDIYGKANNLTYSFEELIRMLKKLREE